MLTVTAVCTTKNRRSWLPQAISCYQSQNYPATHRRMLILADGDDVSDLIPRSDHTILLSNVPPAHLPIKLGPKKNMACSICTSDVICMFDDDDYSAPGRVRDQVARLESSKKQVTGYHTMLFTNGERWWRYAGQPNFALGTSLCFYRSWWQRHPFHDIHQASDNNFVWAAGKCGEIVCADAMNYMAASNHPATTNRREDVGKRHDFHLLPEDFAGVEGYRWLGG